MLPQMRLQRLKVRKMRTSIKTLTGIVTVLCVVASPLGALASDLVIFPDVHDFGNILVGTSSTTIVTVTNLGDSQAELCADIFGGEVFVITSGIPSFIYPGETIDIEIMFNPTTAGYASSEMPVCGTGGASFGGMGVASEPPVEPTIEGILEFFDTSVASGTLVGNGPGNSAEGRKKALRNKIEAAGDLVSEGHIEGACNLLINAYLRCDGLTMPPEFVAGPAAPTLAGMILDLIDGLGYE